MNNKFRSLLKGKSPTYAVLFVVLVLYTVMLFIPLLWTVLTAFKDTKFYSQAIRNEDAARLINLSHLTFDNFVTAFKDFKVTTPTDGVSYNIIGMFGNSLLYSVGCGLIATIVPCIG